LQHQGEPLGDDTMPELAALIKHASDDGTNRHQAQAKYEHPHR
jgi:hypothetical protein